MAELSKTNHAEIHSYSGSREMTTGRKMKIQFTGGGAEETVLEETCPSGESWTVRIAVRKIIDND